MARREHARDDILGKVRAGLREANRTPSHNIPRDYAQERGVTDPVTLFQERVGDYQATVVRVTSRAVASALVAAVRDHGARRILVPPGFPEQWQAPLSGEFEVVDGTATGTNELDQLDAVVTTSTVGIANTGTIVLDHGPGQGRRAATLIPDVHVCLVTEQQVVDDVPAALARLDPTRPLTFISGPSATSDIELDRVEGVHGPRTLHVLLVED